MPTHDQFLTSRLIAPNPAGIDGVAHKHPGFAGKFRLAILLTYSLWNLERCYRCKCGKYRWADRDFLTYLHEIEYHKDGVLEEVAVHRGESGNSAAPVYSVKVMMQNRSFSCHSSSNWSSSHSKQSLTDLWLSAIPSKETFYSSTLFSRSSGSCAKRYQS